MAETKSSEKRQNESRKRLDRLSSLSAESMKVISESIGVSRLSEDTLQCLAEDATYKLKEILQVRILASNDASRINLILWAIICRASLSDIYQKFYSQ